MKRVVGLVGLLATIISAAAAFADDPEHGAHMIEQALSAPPTQKITQPHSLPAILADPSLRAVVPSIDIPAIRFRFNSDQLEPSEIGKLADVGEAIKTITKMRPGEVFLVEGYTDGNGRAAYNLQLSSRRAAAVAEALIEGWKIPAGSLFTVGYGEQFLIVPTQEPNVKNRRVTVRRITPLLHAEAN